MEKMINNFSIGLFLWQIFLLIIAIAIGYFLVKLYKRSMNR